MRCIANDRPDDQHCQQRSAQRKQQRHRARNRAQFFLNHRRNRTRPSINHLLSLSTDSFARGRLAQIFAAELRPAAAPEHRSCRQNIEPEKPQGLSDDAMFVPYRFPHALQQPTPAEATGERHAQLWPTPEPRAPRSACLAKV